MNKTFQTFIQYLRGSSRLGFRVLVGEKMNNINTESNSNKEAVYCQEKSGFRIATEPTIFVL